MLDYKQLNTYSIESKRDIEKLLAEGNVVGAKLRKDLWVEQFLEHITQDRSCHMLIPNYVLRIAKSIKEIPFIEVTVAP